MIKSLFSLAIVASMAAFPVTAKAESFTAEQKAEIQEMFKEYIMNNGDVLMDSVAKYQMDQEAKRQEEALKNIKESSKELYSSNSPHVGPDDADVTIVEFFDYNCGYCKKALTEVKALIKDDKKVKVVFKEFPIFGEPSMEAARWALAAQKQDKYFEFHAALMEFKGNKSEAVFEKIAKDLELDIDKLKKDKTSKEVEDEIKASMELAGKFGIRGTPAFIIGDDLSPGYVPAAQLKLMVDKARKTDG